MSFYCNIFLFRFLIVCDVGLSKMYLVRKFTFKWFYLPFQIPGTRQKKSLLITQWEVCTVYGLNQYATLLFRLGCKGKKWGDGVDYLVEVK